MYVESSHGQPGDKSYLGFSPFTTSNPSSLWFSYHMSGSDIGTLEIISQDGSSSVVTSLWNKTGNQGHYWFKECIELVPDTEQHIFFVAKRGAGFNGDTAVDNVFVNQRRCPGIIILN